MPKNAKSKAKPKTAAKKTQARPATKKVEFKAVAISQKQTKAEIYADIAEATGLEKKSVRAVMSALQVQIARHLKTKGSGEISLPELGIKVRKVMRPATKARPGRNPFTGEEIMIPAKPKRVSAKATALKGLKELVS